MTGWRRRVRPVSGPRELQQLRDAAQDIAERSGLAPSRARVVFQTVADCALIGTALISGGLAAIHLYKALFPKPHGDRHGPSLDPDLRRDAGAGSEPPRRRDDGRLTAAGGDERSGRGRS
jgi:hypothetical protein